MRNMEKSQYTIRTLVRRLLQPGLCLMQRFRLDLRHAVQFCSCLVHFPCHLGRSCSFLLRGIPALLRDPVSGGSDWQPRGHIAMFWVSICFNLSQHLVVHKAVALMQSSLVQKSLQCLTQQQVLMKFRKSF